MDCTHTSFSIDESYARIREVLDSADAGYEDRKDIPSGDALTYTNGFYVACSAVFIDIRGSKRLTEKHTRPVLAKIYRAYISECIAVMRDNPDVRHINIEGDCVWGVFATPYKTDINRVFQTCYELASLVDVLNWRLDKRAYSQIDVGIGCSYGDALMIKAGHKGSAVNDVVYMGDVVNAAAKLCSLGNRALFSKEIYVSNDLYNNLSETNAKLLVRDWDNDCYCGNIVSKSWNEWLEDKKKS
jgi:class 3 adenylate cyclase